MVLRDGTALELRLEGDPSTPESCYLLQQVQGLDSRELREVVEDLPDRDGDYLGGVRQAGVVLLFDVTIVGIDKADVRARERALRAALAPSSATWQARIEGRTGDPETLVAQVRTSAPLRGPHNVANGTRLQPAGFGLRSPDSVLYGLAEHLATVLPADEAAGFTFPMSFPLAFEGSPGPGTTVTNDGDAPSFPVIRLYGPMSNLLIENLASGRQLVFPGTIDAGTFLEVVTSTKAITLGGDPALSRYTALSRLVSSWWPLEPGPNLVRLRAGTWSGAARAELSWRSAYR